MVSGTVTVCTRLPEAARTMSEYDPAATDEPAVRVRLEAPPPAMDAGLKVAVTPAGVPVTERVTDELNPPAAVVETVTRPDAVRDSVTAETEVPREKFGATETTSVNLAVRTMLPEVPVMVMG